MSIMTTLKSIPAMLSSVKFWVISTVLVSIITGVGWMAYDYRNTLQELAVAEKSIVELKNKIVNIDNKIKEEKQRTKTLRENNSIISSQYLAKIRDLQSMQRNIKLAKAEPDQTATKIEASFNVFMSDVSCITGDTTQCPK